MKIKISSSGVQMEAVLNETETARAVWDCLPVAGEVNTWGEEIYFKIPVTMEEENAVEVVNEGDLAYWPPGRCFCIFFGQTPISTPTEIKPAGPVNIIGHLAGDPKAWKVVTDGAEITIEKA